MEMDKEKPDKIVNLTRKKYILDNIYLSKPMDPF